MSIADVMSTLQGVEYRIDGVSLVFDGDDADFRELVAYFTANAPCEVTNSGKSIFISPKNEHIWRLWEVVREIIARTGGHPVTALEQAFDLIDELPPE